MSRSANRLISDEVIDSLFHFFAKNRPLQRPEFCRQAIENNPALRQLPMHFYLFFTTKSNDQGDLTTHFMPARFILSLMLPLWFIEKSADQPLLKQRMKDYYVQHVVTKVSHVVVGMMTAELPRFTEEITKYFLANPELNKQVKRYERDQECLYEIPANPFSREFQDMLNRYFSRLWKKLN